ncbi:MAG TPA: acyltransferase [bacterium]|jgi:peptidoglycan/LPS O-acetylase OafA/YrhL|nr:acyltransferase [bacterium]
MNPSTEKEKPVPSRNSPLRIQAIDLVRTISIFTVLFQHFISSTIAFHPDSSAVWGMVQFFGMRGRDGVYMFFVISGFLITRQIASGPQGLFEPDLRDFYSRRFGRIIPLLALICFIGALAMGISNTITPALAYCFKDSNFHPGAGFWITILTFQFNWYQIALDVWSHATVEPGLHWVVLWSLAIEEQFYFFYPLFLRLLGGKRPFLMALGFIIPFGAVFTGALYLFTRPHNYFDRNNSFAGFSLIAMGALLYLLLESHKDLFSRKRALCLGLVFVGPALILATWILVPNPRDAWIPLTPLLIGAGVFLFLLGGMNLDFFESKLLAPLCFPGKLSYGMYLLHVSVLFVLWPFLTGEGALVGLSVFVAATIGLSYLCYRFYEMPANFFIRNKLKHKKAGSN